MPPSFHKFAGGFRRDCVICGESILCLFLQVWRFLVLAVEACRSAHERIQYKYYISVPERTECSIVWCKRRGNGIFFGDPVSRAYQRNASSWCAIISTFFELFSNFTGNAWASPVDWDTTKACRTRFGHRASSHFFETFHSFRTNQHPFCFPKWIVGPKRLLCWRPSVYVKHVDVSHIADMGAFD